MAFGGWGHPITPNGGTMSESLRRLSPDEIAAEIGTPLPAKEVMSLLNLDVDLDLALDLAAPIDLAVAANANVAAPIDAAVSANVLSLFSESGAMAKQAVMIDQYISGEAIADAPQTAVVDQEGSDAAAGDTDLGDAGTDVADAGTDGADAGTDAGADAGTGTDTVDVADGTDVAPSDAVTDTAGDTVGDTAGTVTDTVGDTTGDVVDTVDDTTGTVTDTVGDTTGDVVDTVDDTVDGTTGMLDGALEGDLLDVNVHVTLDADLAAPIAGAVAANANVAAPIDAAAAANIGAINSEATAVADQTAIITQQLDGVTAHATAAQDAEITQ